MLTLGMKVMWAVIPSLALVAIIARRMAYLFPGEVGDAVETVSWLVVGVAIGKALFWLAGMGCTP